MDLICARIAQGYTLRQIGRELGCNHSAIVLWYAADPIFADRYARAKEAQAERFAEEIVEICDDGTNDWQRRELESGAIVEVPDQEHINRSRLRVDARKWLMAKMAPKRYGERIQLDHGKAEEAAELPYERLLAMANGAEPLMIEHEPHTEDGGEMMPPKCRSCGKAEWNHTCAGPARRMTPAVHARLAVVHAEPISVASVHAEPTVDIKPARAVHDPDRIAARRAYKAEHERKRRAKLREGRC